MVIRMHSDPVSLFLHTHNKARILFRKLSDYEKVAFI